MKIHLFYFFTIKKSFDTQFALPFTLGVHMTNSTSRTAFPMDDPTLYAVWKSEKEKRYVPRDNHQGPSLCKRGVYAVMAFVYETPAKGLGFVIAALAAKFIFAPFAAPFWGLSGGMITGRLFIKVLQAGRCRCHEHIQRSNLALIRRIPWMQLVGVILALGLGVLWAPAGITVGVGIGILGGINVSIDHALRRQRLNAERRKREEARGPYKLGRFEAVT